MTDPAPVRSVELLFDEATERALRDEWSALLAADLPSLATHRGATNRPHLTVAAGPGLEVADTVSTAFERMPLPVEFSGLLLFPSGRSSFVLSRAVVVTPELVELHRAAHASISGAVDLTRPGRWTPHATVARRLTAAQVAEAAPLLRHAPTDAAIVAARLWDSGTKTVAPLG